MLCTDFGLAGPYLGQVHTVLCQQAPHIPVVTLFADLPAFNVRASAYLLAAYTAEFPRQTVVLGVVDPGVGGPRRPLAVQADGRWYVGPDNGLFVPLLKRAHQSRVWALTDQPARLSASFHGRDLFAPVAARLALGEAAPGEPLALKALETYCDDWPNDLTQIIYIDHYGNALTGIRAASLAHDCVLEVGAHAFTFARTFCEADLNRPFWYENANGLVELALREQAAASVLGLKIGDPVHLN